jgi:hypothetical protein
MTREQMIDEAVRRSMARRTMRRVDDQAKRIARFRVARPGWWKDMPGTDAEHALKGFAGCVSAIRNEFKRS